ncbi:uncharacterized protein LOC123011667 [Tribolium madens]|uniref:uncharacterized protein LOC123011667 n=1 Tax=Tribolium madens TaxID=41895 RepID=UPI001CF7451D|nr:uncharacterized protein LOC123011667 [Tribolium madens]
MIITRTNKTIENLFVVYKKQKRENIDKLGETTVKMWLKICVFLVIIETSFGQSNNFSLNVNKRRPYHDYDPYYHHYHHELLYGGGLLYYLTFILIKVKVVFVLGTIFTIFLVAGKFFAIVKYAEYMKSPKHHEPEKVYVHEPPHFDSYSPHYGRNFPNYYDIFVKILQNANLTDTAFRRMKLNSVACRKKFVCKTDYKAKFSQILATTLTIFTDENYDKYKTNTTIESLQDCDKLYQSCRNNKI